MLKRNRYLYWLRYGIGTYEYINVQNQKKYLNCKNAHLLGKLISFQGKNSRDLASCNKIYSIIDDDVMFEIMLDRCTYMYNDTSRDTCQ